MVEDARTAGASVEVFDYPGSGHLFTDPGLPDEHDEQAAALLWPCALRFCRHHAAGLPTGRRAVPTDGCSTTPERMSAGSRAAELGVRLLAYDGVRWRSATVAIALSMSLLTKPLGSRIAVQ